jgi:hypothetical protein
MDLRNSRARRIPAVLAARMDLSTSRTRLVLHPAPLELLQHVWSRRKTGLVALIAKTTQGGQRGEVSLDCVQTAEWLTKGLPVRPYAELNPLNTLSAEQKRKDALRDVLEKVEIAECPCNS